MGLIATRKARAKWLASGTAAMVVGLAALFAALQNVADVSATPSKHATPPTPRAAQPALSEAGRRAFERHCAMCHGFAGLGNPTSPLEGVGGRLQAESLRAWSTGSGEAAASLPAGIVRRKAAATGPDVEALLEDLARSR